MSFNTEVAMMPPQKISCNYLEESGMSSSSKIPDFATDLGRKAGEGMEFYWKTAFVVSLVEINMSFYMQM